MKISLLLGLNGASRTSPKLKPNSYSIHPTERLYDHEKEDEQQERRYKNYPHTSHSHTESGSDALPIGRDLLSPWFRTTSLAEIDSLNAL